MKLGYAYHCEPPIVGLDDALAEHERCVDLWDELVDIERRTERTVEDAAATAYPDIAVALREIVDLSTAIHAAPNRDARKPMIQSRREARRRVWEGLKKWRTSHKDEARAIEGQRQAEVKAARQARDTRSDAPMYWPNYNAVIARYEAARAGARQFGRRLRHHDPLRDDGVLAVQIQRTRTGLGAAPDELSLSMLTIEALPPSAWSGPKKQRLIHVRMRIDAAGHTVTVPMLMHRPLPTGCRVKGAQLCWRRIGLQTRWQLVLQLADVPTQPPAAYRTHGTLDLCWAQSDDGLVVARPSWRDPYVLPADWIETGKRLREQQSWLDSSLNEQRDIADEKTRAQLDGGQRAVYALRREQLPQSIREWLTSWRRIWWQTDHGRRKWLARRQWIYRQWAREIVRERTDLVMDARRLDKIARAERWADGNGLRQMAAVHTLRAEIIHQANKIGARVVAGEGASACVLTQDGQAKSGAWQRRKSAKEQRSRSAAETQVSQ